MRVPYTADFIKGSISIDADSEISDEQEAEIYRYYNVQGHGTGTATVYTESASSTDHRATGTDVAAGGVASNLTGSASAGCTVATDKDILAVLSPGLTPLLYSTVWKRHR